VVVVITRGSGGIFGAKRDEVTGSGENYIMRSLMFYTAHPVSVG